MALATPESGLTEAPAEIYWDKHVGGVLASPNADELIKYYQNFANEVDPGRTNIAGIYFGPIDIYPAAQRRAQHEIATGRAGVVNYTNMPEGGTPFHTDLTTAMMMQPGSPTIETDRIKVSAYNENGQRRGAQVDKRPEHHPTTLKEGDTVVLVDDGDDTGDSLRVTASWLRIHRGITDVHAVLSRSKIPEVEIEGISSKVFDHVTPDAYETMYGFHGHRDAGRNARGMGLAMLQPPEKLEMAEHILTVLGGKEGLARVTIDDIRRYNQEHDS